MTAGFQPSPTWEAPRTPVSWWASVGNQVVGILQRLGFVVGAMQMLTVAGRQSGVRRSAPVPVLTVGGQRYIVACRADAAWVDDARAAGRGILHRGRGEEAVALVELPVSERPPILREVPHLVPGAVPFFTRHHAIPATPEAFASLAAHLPVFRAEGDWVMG
jgi:hypothetical protein